MKQITYNEGMITIRVQPFIKIFRFRGKIAKLKIKPLTFIIDLIFQVVFSCNIPATVKLGKNPIFPHSGLGVVIDKRTIIGNNAKIYQNVTIGWRNGEGPPIIGNDVLIGAGASVLGKIKIGNNVQIGTNAVVISDVPDNCIAVGVPAKIIKNK